MDELTKQFKEVVSKKIIRLSDSYEKEEITALFSAIKRIKDVEVFHDRAFTTVIIEGENFDRVCGTSKCNPNDNYSYSAGIGVAMSHAAENFMDEIYFTEIQPPENEGETYDLPQEPVSGAV